MKLADPEPTANPDLQTEAVIEIRFIKFYLTSRAWMAAAPSCTWVDCPADWGWTMILHWQGTQPSLMDSKH
jgi:hypothetical protein